MKRQARNFLTAIGMFAFVIFAAPVSRASALDCSKMPDSATPACYADVCANNATKDTTLCKSVKNTTNPVSGKDGILAVATKLVSYLVGIASILGVLIGGIRYTMASGDANSVSASKKMVIYSLIGILVALFAQALVILVLR
jgi:hypothetical protein